MFSAPPLLSCPVVGYGMCSVRPARLCTIIGPETYTEFLGRVRCLPPALKNRFQEIYIYIYIRYIYMSHHSHYQAHPEQCHTLADLISLKLAATRRKYTYIRGTEVKRQWSCRTRRFSSWACSPSVGLALKTRSRQTIPSPSRSAMRTSLSQFDTRLPLRGCTSSRRTAAPVAAV